VSGYVIALDVGGTSIKAALLGPGSSPLYELRRRTPRADGPEAVVEAVLACAEDLRRHGQSRYGAPPEAVGVAVPGILDEAEGVAVFSANLGWRGVPLRTRLTERLGGLPVALGHDVRAGGLAEGRIGAGHGVERFLFVSLGTGIAGAVGAGGRVEPGAHGSAGEIGHIVVRPGGRLCGCGGYGCLETVASAAAVGRAWAEASGESGATSADAARAVAAGDTRAAAVWSEAVDALADGLVTGLTLLDPGTVIIGGGLSEAGDTLFAPLREAVKRRVTFQHVPPIVPAGLGDGAGCLGAGLLAWDLHAAEVAGR
jgi:glucokinase